ncbi:hypothetical protein A3Q35_13975 [Aeribacillus pallidus]|uniref:restriction endonuclease subunit S n=1 Tax=Aeribacillus pallidus TaxID=33936 RepID=UPI0007B4C0A7|nr:restriction endonuclease subunit S [Aeribacillus pallidus]KZM54639.1 hypothetical protein A3Q35_13975 [Aeribacillus pallidus]
MSKKKQKSIEELLEEALVPEEEHPYIVPKNWVWTRTGIIHEIVTGATPSKKNNEYYGGNFPFVKPGDLDQEDSVIVASEYLTDKGKEVSRIIPKHSTLVCCIGSIGKTGFNLVECTTNQQINSLIPNKKVIYPKYTYYFSLSSTYQNLLLKSSSSTTVSIINKSKMSKLPFALPPLNEQKRIAEKIERLFAKIDEAKRLIEEVKGSFEPRRAAILDRAFGGRLGTNDPKEKSMFETFNELTEKDLIPKEEQPYEVPKNWVWIRLGSFLPPMETRDLARLESENFLYVDIDSIDNNKFEIREPKIIEIKNAPSRAKRRIDKGDVIISLVRPYLRNVARVLFDDPRLVASTAFYVCKRNKVTETNYLYYYLITSFVTNYLNVRTKGHNAPSVRNSDFLELPIPIPPVEEQKRIAEKVDILLSKLETEKEMVLEVEQKLNSLKQSILNKAFRGELGTNDPTDEHAIELLKEVLKYK